MSLHAKLQHGLASAKPIDNILKTPVQAHRIDLRLRDFSPLGAAVRSHKVAIYLVTRGTTVDVWYGNKIDELFAESAFLSSIEGMYRQYVDKNDEDPMSEEWRCCTDAEYERYLKEGILPFFDLDYIVMDHKRGEVMFKLETEVDGKLAEHGFNVVEAGGQWRYECDGAYLCYLDDEAPSPPKPKAKPARKSKKSAARLRHTAMADARRYQLVINDYDKLLALVVDHSVNIASAKGLTRKQFLDGETAVRSYADFLSTRLAGDLRLCGLELCVWTAWLDTLAVSYTVDERPAYCFDDFPVSASKHGIERFFAKLQIRFWEFQESVEDFHALLPKFASKPLPDWMGNDCFWLWGVVGRSGDALSAILGRK